VSSSPNFVTSKIIFSFFKLWRASSFEPGDDPKFSVSLLFNKADAQGISALEQQYNTVLQADFDGSLPYGAKPGWLVDGAVRYPSDPFYADKMILNCSQSAERPPQILDMATTPIMDQSKAGSGFDGHALISFYGYQGGSKGISASIHGVMVDSKQHDLGGNSVDAVEGFAQSGFAQSGYAPTHPPVQQPTHPPVQQPPVQQPPQTTQAPPTKPVMLPAANGQTYDQLIAAGWTDAQLIEHKFMA
jgi:hypothetical protein